MPDKFQDGTASMPAEQSFYMSEGEIVNYRLVDKYAAPLAFRQENPPPDGADQNADTASPACVPGDVDPFRSTIRMQRLTVFAHFTTPPPITLQNAVRF